MAKSIFTNDVILSWLEYFSKSSPIDLAKIKMLDLTRENKNLIPTVMSNRTVLVFTDAGHPEIFYEMWNAELGNCVIWYNEGSDPHGEMKSDKVSDMIDRGINSSAAMLIMNPDAKTNYHIGMENSRFSCGSVQYVCSEVRTVIMNKLDLGDRDNICIVSGESIAVESSLIVSEGNVVAVEYDPKDRVTMQENMEKFGLKNVSIVDSIEEGYPSELPVPDVAFIVASKRIDQEIKSLIKVNRNIKIIIYTLDFEILMSMAQIFKDNELTRKEIVNIAVSRVNSKNMIEPFPAPWLISGLIEK